MLIITTQSNVSSEAWSESAKYNKIKTRRQEKKKKMSLSSQIQELALYSILAAAGSQTKVLTYDK